MASLLTGIYALKVDNVQPEIIHLFEHLVISGFDDYLVRNKFEPYLKGWVSGQTYKRVMFIDYGFYNTKVEKLFKKYLKLKPNFNDLQIDIQLSRLCCESKTTYYIKNKNQLKNELYKISENNWINLSYDHKAEYINKRNFKFNKLLIESPKQDKYNANKYAIGLVSEDVNIIAAYFRLFPIIHDSIISEINKIGLYSPEYSDFKYLPKNKLIFNEITIISPNKTSKQDIVNIIDKVKNININDLNKEIKMYLDSYLHTPNWSTFSLDYFDATNIIASKQQITKSLLDKKVIKEIFKNIQIKTK